jgi:hypothetical protein
VIRSFVNPDLHTDLHMNTYVSLAARGVRCPAEADAVMGLPIHPMAWTAPPTDGRASIDDL